MRILYIIPARGGSKRIPGKNIKLLVGKPLIQYTIECARELAQDKDICVSTDDDDIIKVVEGFGLKIPFKRPDYLSTDTATTSDVILHALDYYEGLNRNYDLAVVLQPTSPLRKANHVIEAINLYSEDTDMIVSVKKFRSAAFICHETENFLLEFSLIDESRRGASHEDFFEYNGAIYVISVEKLKKFGLHGLKRKKKYLMNEMESVDIDNEIDFLYASILINTNDSK